MAIQKLIGLVGLSKQTAKGSAAAAATYGVGLRDGRVFALPIDQELDPLTLAGGASDRFAPHAARTKMAPGAGFTTRCWPRSIPLLVYGASGTLTTTGAGAPYSHAATPGIDLPYLTLFGRQGSQYIKLPDCKIDELTLSWEEASPVDVQAAILGLTPALNQGSWSPTNDETTQGFFGGAGGTLQLDTGSATPATAKITAAELSIKNNLEGLYLANSVLPDDLIPASQVMEGSITLKPDDFTDWSKIVTGTGAGTAIQSAVQYGSVNLVLTIDANTDLTLNALRVAFMADFPDSDPGGGAGVLELAFQTVRPTGGTAAFTWTTRNAVASY
ncbi:MAG: phage tail tube protein [Actinomycetota bacterium]